MPRASLQASIAWRSPCQTPGRGDMGVIDETSLCECTEHPFLMGEEDKTNTCEPFSF